MSPTCPICDFILAHLAEVHFVCGLAFFITGIVVYPQATRHSQLRLAQALPFLAAFGLLHGTHEWLAMFEIFASGPIPLVARLLRLAILIVSLIPLVEFGLRLRGLTGGRRVPLARWMLLTISLVGSALISLRWGPAGREAWIPALDAWYRYSLAIPGSLLAAVGMYQYAQEMEDHESKLPTNLRVVALAFLFYAIPSQLFAAPSPLPPSTSINTISFMATVHFPIQLVRTLTALVVVVFTARGIHSFERERRRRLHELNEEMIECRALRREFLHRTVQAQEEERRYIARELHDETAQALTALSLGLRNAEEMIEGNPDEARAHLSSLRGLVEDMLEKVSQLTTRLRPLMLDDLGLIPTLIDYADETAQHLPFELDVQVTGRRRRLPPEIETNLYRIAQESLTNVAKHAQATHASVHLHLGATEAILTVSDDGIGIPPERAEDAAARRDGWGLTGIHERAELLNGEVVIRSKQDAGTEIEARIPTPQSYRASEERHT